MSDIAIKVENLSKRYRIGLKEEMHDTFTGAITSWIKSPLANYRRLRRLTTFEEHQHEVSRTKNTDGVLAIQGSGSHREYLTKKQRGIIS